jgi:hypothetical protein
MDLLLKTLKIVLLGLLLLSPTACATSDEDLNYTRKSLDDSGGDSSYHGWSAPPKEKSEYSQ